MAKNLVVHNGIQYTTDKLPAGVELADCKPLAQWLKSNATTRPDPVPADNDPTASDAIAALEAERDELRAQLEAAQAGNDKSPADAATKKGK